MLGSNGSCYATTSATLKLGTSSLNTTTTQGETAYLSSTISATTTDTESYTLTITGPTSLTGATAITGADGKTGSTMSNNTWGYSYNQAGDNSNKTYTSFTGTAQTLESGTIANGSTKNITFAARFSNDAIAGHYTAKVVVGLVATPKEVAFNGITTMQEMTISICAAASENETTQLTDTRDGKSYWIAKLKDGNCWMTQNLAWGETSDEYIYNPGQYVVVNPSVTTNTCNSTSDNIVSCGNVVDVSGKIASSDPDFYSKNGVTYNDVEYDAHYAVGNYYNYGITSVCPAGWSTPLATTSKDSLEYLVNQYNLSTVRNTPLFMVASGYVLDTRYGNDNGVYQIVGMNTSAYYAIGGRATSRGVAVPGSTCSSTGAKTFSITDGIIKTDTSSCTGYDYSIRCYITNV